MFLIFRYIRKSGNALWAAMFFFKIKFNLDISVEGHLSPSAHLFQIVFFF